MDCPVMKSQTNTEPKNGFFSSQKTKKQTKKKGQCKKLPKLQNQTPQSSSPQTVVIQSNSLQNYMACTYMTTCTNLHQDCWNTCKLATATLHSSTMKKMH